MDDEPDTYTVAYEEWHELLDAAAGLDLVHGGYFRARSRKIEFYCGPDNTPPGWNSGFGEGSPENARAAVGVAELVRPIGSDGVEIRLRVTNWSALREITSAQTRGDYEDRPEQFAHDEELALRGRLEEWRWLRRQFRKLREHVAGSMLERG